MDKKLARQLCNTLVLAFCICSLAVHFIAENLSVVSSQAMIGLSENASQSQGALDGSDDLILASVGKVPLDYFQTPAVPQAPIHYLPVLITPLLPPPNS